jgi:hypothetical protein
MRKQREQIQRHTLFLLAGAILALVVQMAPARAERIKDLASVAGVRQNQLIGYGLVVGLDGTGDQTTQAPFTTQSLINMLERLGVTVPAGTSIQLKNVAAVAVHGDLPAFAKTGQTIDSRVVDCNAKLGAAHSSSPLKALTARLAMAQATRWRTGNVRRGRLADLDQCSQRRPGSKRRHRRARSNDDHWRSGTPDAEPAPPRLHDLHAACGHHQWPAGRRNRAGARSDVRAGARTGDPDGPDQPHLHDREPRVHAR